MNSFGGLQTGWTPNTPTVSTNQGMPGLMGNVYPPAAQVPSLMNTSPGDWSQVAYNMAGRPTQGPYPSVPTPPMPAGITNGTQSGGGSSIGGTALGLLGSLAKNPSLLKSAVSGITGLFGPTAAETAAIGPAADAAATATTDAIAATPVAPIAPSGLMAGAPAAAAPALAALGPDALAPIGTSAVAPAADAAAADAAAALAPSDTTAAAAGGLGVGAGAAAAGGLFALPLILAGTVAQHDRNASQYASMLSDLNAGPSSPGYNGSMMEVVADIASGQTGEYPAAVLQKAQQLGLYQTAQNLGAYKGAVGTGGTAARSRNQQ